MGNMDIKPNIKEDTGKLRVSEVNSSSGDHECRYYTDIYSKELKKS